MKAIILAAGEGTRLKKYTRNLPKGMLAYQGKTLIEHQLLCFRRCGIDSIGIVRGYCGNTIAYDDVSLFENDQWATTNMVHSLMCAKSMFDEDVVVSYADVFFTDRLLLTVLDCKAEIGVAVDLDWKSYWQRRYDRVNFDTESFEIDEAGRVVSLGCPDPPLAEIDGRYVGVLKFSRTALTRMVELYEQLSKSQWDDPWQQSGKPFRQAYMTDLLQELIDRGETVQAVQVHGGWLEFDTNADYERQRDWVVSDVQRSESGVKSWV